MSARILGNVRLPAHDRNHESRICIYLFHGKAARTIVLAIIASMQTAKERNVKEMLRVKVAAEALQQLLSLEHVGPICSDGIGNDLLDHLGRLLLDGFGLLYEVVPRCIGPRARST